jgi:hypothetical protein
VKPPLILVTGTMGSGKSTVAERLAVLLDEHVVFDIDWAIESLGMVAGHPIPEYPPAWPGVADTWLAIAAAIARGGRSTVLCGPFDSDIDDLPSLRLHQDVRWLLLDCADELLRSRLGDRGWESADIDDAVRYAERLRSAGYQVVRTDTRSPDDVAAEVTAWVEAVQ